MYSHVKLIRMVCIVFCNNYIITVAMKASVSAFGFSNILTVFSFSELMFLETSALTGENVEETFLKCARSILTKIESGKYIALSIIVCVHVYPPLTL